MRGKLIVCEASLCLTRSFARFIGPNWTTTSVGPGGFDRETFPGGTSAFDPVKTLGLRGVT